MNKRIFFTTIFVLFCHILANGQTFPFCLNRGDVNDDGYITPLDSILTFQYYSFGTLPENVQLCRMDVDNDGKVTANDANIIYEFGKAIYMDLKVDKTIVSRGETFNVDVWLAHYDINYLGRDICYICESCTHCNENEIFYLIESNKYYLEILKISIGDYGKMFNISFYNEDYIRVGFPALDKSITGTKSGQIMKIKFKMKDNLIFQNNEQIYIGAWFVENPINDKFICINLKKD